MHEDCSINVRVNGVTFQQTVPVRQTLVDFLRDSLGLTGTHVACEHGVCGACHVRMNGETIRSCTLLAVQADGSEIETVEGLSCNPLGAALQEAFIKCGGFQCGFCTPGMLFTAMDIVESGARDRMAIREGLSGNACRCTGYQPIVDAIQSVAESR